MPNYKLTYFDARCKGEPARMLFSLVGQYFEDVRYDVYGEEWPKMKADVKRCPNGQLPVLDVDGKLLTQSRAINRYIAREFKGPDGHDYYGKTNVECAKIDEIMGIVADLEPAINPAFEISDPAEREAYLVENRDKELKKYYNFFSEALKISGGKYFVGNRLTLADIMVYNQMDFYLESVLGLKSYFEPYPILTKFYDSIKADSPLTPYIKTRKYTNF